jgi:hypothetical protein
MQTFQMAYFTLSSHTEPESQYRHESKTRTLSQLPKRVFNIVKKKYSFHSSFLAVSFQLFGIFVFIGYRRFYSDLNHFM